jgi:hypothetical protein
VQRERRKRIEIAKAGLRGPRTLAFLAEDKGEDDMRGLAIVPLLLLAACGDAGGANQATNVQPAAAERIAPGQWALDSEVTMFAKADQGTPAIDMPQGTHASASVCVGAGDPPPALFAGDGYDCHSDSVYARNGRLAVTLTCTKEGLSGNILMSLSGDFTGDTIEYDRSVRTSLVTDGDVTFTQHVTGRRTGDCAGDAGGGGNASAPAPSGG